MPLIASLVKVGMTNAAEEDFHLDVGGAGFATGNRERGQGGGGGLRRVGSGAGCIHGQTIVRDLSASTGCGTSRSCGVWLSSSRRDCLKLRRSPVFDMASFNSQALTPLLRLS